MENKPDIRDVTAAIHEASDLEEIGEGGFKVVYRARIDDKVEALKLVRIPRDDHDPTVREANIQRIHREVAILGECRTPYLVKLGSITPRESVLGDSEYVAYSEEYVPGQTLSELIRIGYKPPQNEIASTGLCLLLAINELISKNFIHRDIKPNNIIKTEDIERPFVLLDLGIAFKIGGTQITRDSRSIMGTRYYIAPEMLEEGFRQNLDFRADLYTIGLTLYEYASSTNPFRDPWDPEIVTLYRIATVNPTPLATLRPDLPRELTGLIDQLLKKLPALRPSNIQMLLRRMEAFQ